MTDFDAIVDRMGPAARGFFDGDSNDLTVNTERVVVQPGRTLSQEATLAATRMVTTFMLARMLRRWRDTGEPPSVVRLTVHVDIG